MCIQLETEFFLAITDAYLRLNELLLTEEPSCLDHKLIQLPQKKLKVLVSKQVLLTLM